LEVANGSGMDLERSPRPTLRRAILVPNLLNMVVVSWKNNVVQRLIGIERERREV
jgi:hypothetical protein